MILCTFAHGTRVNGWLTFTKSLCLPLIIWRALVTARSQVALVGTWLRFMMAVCRVDLFTLTEEGDICIILQIKGYYLLLSSFQIDELLLSSTWQYRKKKVHALCSVDWSSSTALCHVQESESSHAIVVARTELSSSSLNSTCSTVYTHFKEAIQWSDWHTCRWTYLWDNEVECTIVLPLNRGIAGRVETDGPVRPDQWAISRKKSSEIENMRNGIVSNLKLYIVHRVVRFLLLMVGTGYATS
jgi:hypothetical protein